MSVSDRSSELLSRVRSYVLVVDVQEKLIPVVSGSDQIVAEVGLLLNAASVLDVPVMVSEQYPQGLGPTVPPIAENAAIQSTFEKLRFSGASEFCESAASQGACNGDSPGQVVLAGIETHICILQTAFDLQQAGWDVFVVANAVGSRRCSDHEAGLARMSRGGIRLLTTESVLFEWCEAAGNDSFRQISRLVRNHPV